MMKSHVTLRSSKWLDDAELSGFVHRTAFRSSGFSRESFEGRPVIGICNSASELVSCNLGFKDLAESVKRGCSKRAASRSSSPRWRSVSS